MRLLLLPILLFGLVEGGAQHTHLRLKTDETEVPKGVVGSFRKQYVRAAEAAWTIISSSTLQQEFGIFDERKGEKLTYYEVSFSESDGNKEVVYDHYGIRVGVKKVIATSSLPSPIVKTVLSLGESADVVSAAEVSEPAAVAIHYMIVISQAGELQSLIVGSAGEVIKKN